jgi:hypothetical protein
VFSFKGTLTELYNSELIVEVKDNKKGNFLKGVSLMGLKDNSIITAVIK